MTSSLRILVPLDRSSTSVSLQRELVLQLALLVIRSSASEHLRVQAFQANSLTVAPRMLANANSISSRVTRLVDLRSRVEIVHSKRSSHSVARSSILNKLVSIRYLAIQRSRTSSSVLVHLSENHSTTRVSATIVSSS